MLRRILALAFLLAGSAALAQPPHTVRVSETPKARQFRSLWPQPAPQPARRRPHRVEGPGQQETSRPAPGGLYHRHDPVHAEGERPRWNLGAGVFNAPDRDGVDAFRAEYRSTLPIFGSGRWLGGVTTGPKDFILPYAGFYWDLALGDRLTFTPATSFGFLSGGDDARFGGTLQFRTNLELSYALDEDQRIGFAIQHVSNAGLDQPNKGSNTQLLTYTVAVGR